MQLKNFGRKFWERRDSLSLQQSSWEGGLKPVPPTPPRFLDIFPPQGVWSQPRGTALRNREARPSDTVVAPGFNGAGS